MGNLRGSVHKKSFRVKNSLKILLLRRGKIPKKYWARPVSHLVLCSCCPAYLTFFSSATGIDFFRENVSAVLLGGQKYLGKDHFVRHGLFSSIKMASKIGET